MLCDTTERNYNVLKVIFIPLYNSSNRAKVRTLTGVKQVKSCRFQGADDIVQVFRLCAIMQKSSITSWITAGASSAITHTGQQSQLNLW